MTTDTTSPTTQACEEALRYCQHNPGWVPIYRLPNSSNHLYKTWGELKRKEQKHWVDRFGKLNASAAWEELAIKPCRVSCGFVAPDGHFSSTYVDNSCMVFKVGMTPEVVALLLDHLEALIVPNVESLTHSHCYMPSFTHIPKPIRDGIVYYHDGWRVRRNWRINLDLRKKYAGI